VGKVTNWALRVRWLNIEYLGQARRNAFDVQISIDE
jgi:hypothetical protein